MTRIVSHFKKVPRYETMRDYDDETDSETEGRDIDRRYANYTESENNEVENRGENQDVRPRRSHRSRIPVQRYGHVIPSDING